MSWMWTRTQRSQSHLSLERDHLDAPQRLSLAWQPSSSSWCLHTLDARSSQRDHCWRTPWSLMQSCQCLPSTLTSLSLHSWCQPELGPSSGSSGSLVQAHTSPHCWGCWAFRHCGNSQCGLLRSVEACRFLCAQDSQVPSLSLSASQEHTRPVSLSSHHCQVCARFLCLRRVFWREAQQSQVLHCSFGTPSSHLSSLIMSVEPRSRCETHSL